MTDQASWQYAVISHMNSDHADACLVIAKAYGKVHDARQARLLDISLAGLVMEITTDEGKLEALAIPFNKPLSRESQIRGMLVGMTKHGRELLAP